MSDQRDMRTCPYCQSMFVPKRRWEAFCTQKCRTSYDQDFGAQGTVASVRRLKKGASVVVHLPDGPAADRAMNLLLNDPVRVTRKP